MLKRNIYTPDIYFLDMATLFYNVEYIKCEYLLVLKFNFNKCLNSVQVQGRKQYLFGLVYRKNKYVNWIEFI